MAQRVNLRDLVLAELEGGDGETMTIMSIMFRLFLPILTALILFSLTIAVTQEEYDYDRGYCIHFDDTQELTEGIEIEFYDCSDGQYHKATIRSVNQDDGIEVEVYDYDEEKHRTFEVEEDVSS